MADCVVFGVPDDEYGERLHGVIEPMPGAEIVPAAVIDWLKARLSGFKVPRTIEITARLPRDETGKLAKRRLRDQHWAGRQRRV
ncbi:Bile acid-coenzyme A ligase [compost metagenome]